MCLLLVLANIKATPSSIIIAGRGSGGRLGDDILLFSKASYLSFKTGVPLVYRDFPYFNRLALSQYEQRYTSAFDSFSPVKILVQDKKAFVDYQSAMFEIDYGCKMRKNNDGHGSYVGCGEFPFDWIKKKMMKYPKFGEQLRRDLQVLAKGRWQSPRNFEGDCATVAVATRMGSGYDGPTLGSEQFFDKGFLALNKNLRRKAVKRFSDIGNPFKFVPQQFYINQVKRLSELLQHRALHIYFFIDKDKDFTEKILAKWRSALVDYKNITIECRVEKDWKERVLDDLDLMSRCDYLIRGCSHFAGAAQLMGEHSIIIGPDPASALWLDRRHLVFKRTFIYFQNVKEYRFEQYVFEDTEKRKLQDLVAQYCNY
jgi:hypothetical protein